MYIYVCVCTKLERVLYAPEGLCCHSEGPQQAGEIGNLQEVHEIVQRGSPSKSCPWGQKSPSSRRSWGQLAGMQLCHALSKLGMRQTWALAAERTNTLLGCVGNCVATRSRQVILNLCSAPGRICQAQLCSPQVQKRSRSSQGP